jgi:fructuronate reductase
MAELETSVPRLSHAALGSARIGTARFSYDRRRLRPRLIHLGLGAFFRAHGALFTEDVLADQDGDWGIIGASLKRPDQRNRLTPQECLYTSVENGRNGRKARSVGCLLNVLVAPENPATLLDRLSDRETAVVTLSVTEKGYHHHPASGRLNTDHPEIRLARLVHQFALLRDNKLAAWIERTVPFPSSMVDRIVPAQAQDDLSLTEQLTGLHDAAPVMHEPFRQWVLEDLFVDGVRPPWERAGVQFVLDVAPFEHAKHRMLNASHSALAYLGYLAGHETIFDAVSADLFARFIKRFWRVEVIPNPGGTTGFESRAVCRSTLRALQQSGDSAQSLADRYGRVTEASAAAPLPLSGTISARNALSSSSRSP